MPADTTLGDTLGNLGSRLTESFNPLNQLRAYDIQQQMWLRQQQVLQMQRENAARQAAIEQWGHIVPADKLPQISLMIYQGAPYEQIARAAAQLSGNLKDDPNAMAENIRYIEQLTGKPYDYATLGPPVAGPNTQKAYDDWKVNQAGKTAASTALGTKTGEQAATANLAAGLKDDTSPEATASNIKIMETMTGKPWDSPFAPVVGPNTQQARNQSDAARAGQQAQATATGTEVGKQTAAAPIVSQYVDKDTPEANANNTRLYMIEHNGELPLDGLPPSVGPVTSAANQARKAAQAGSTAQQTAAGTAAGGGITTNDQKIFPSGLPGSSTNPVGSAPAAAPAPTPAPAAPANVSVQNPAAPQAPPTPVIRQGPGGVVITGQSAPEATASTETTKARSDQLQQAMDEGVAANRLLVKIGQLKDLETIAQTGGAVGQFNAAVAKRLAEGGIVVGDRASALKAMDQILKTEIPDLRKQSGISRLAGPEIQSLNPQIGTADLPPAVLNNILANEEGAAQLQVQRRINAQKTLGLGDQPMSYQDFINADNDLNNQLRARTDALRQQYGAVGTQTPAPTTTVVAPPPQSSSVGNPISAIIQWITGGQSQASPTTPAPNSTELPRNPDGSFSGTGGQ